MRRRICVFLIFCGLLPLFAGPAAAEGLIPVGQTVGLEIRTDGVCVVKLEPASPAEAAGLEAGDRICSVDGVSVRQAEDLRQLVEDSRGEALLFLVERGDKRLSFLVRPVCEAGCWRVGVYVRDRIRGLGTVTFYDPDSGVFGALGHGVSSLDGQAILGGEATETEIVSIKKGAAGTPGALQGGQDPGRCLGRVEENTPRGVFGRTEEPAWEGERLPVAAREEVTTGPAEIWCSVDGSETRRYEAVIEGLSFGAEPCKNLRILVTDPDLLSKTGGIVQGMSGSPIIQNGKLVGAVTHVLIRDPTRGYGILVENMLAGSELCQEIDRAA